MNSLFKKHKLLGLLVLSGALLLFNLGAPGVRGTFFALLAPVQASLWQAGKTSSAFVAGTFQGAGLKERAERLETENLFLTQELASLQEEKRENVRFREALQGAKEEFDLLFVEIIGKEVDRDVLLVNRGAADGIKKDMPVITQSRVAVGSIGEVFEHTSKVLLLSLKGRSFDVKLQEKEAVGVLKGQGRFEAVLDLIPKEVELREGDMLVTSVLGGMFADNLLVGKVLSVDKSDLTAFQGGRVELFFHPSKENSLFVIKNRL
jgi:rod shape-determining protein MreC